MNGDHKLIVVFIVVPACNVKMFDHVENTNLLHLDSTNNGAKASQALRGSPVPYTGKSPSFDKEVVLSVRITSLGTPTIYHVHFDADNVREVTYRFAAGPTGAVTTLQKTATVVKNAAHVDYVLEKPINAEVLYINMKPATTTDLSMTVSNLQLHACIEPCMTNVELHSLFLIMQESEI